MGNIDSHVILLIFLIKPTISPTLNEKMLIGSTFNYLQTCTIITIQYTLHEYKKNVMYEMVVG